MSRNQPFVIVVALLAAANSGATFSPALAEEQVGRGRVAGGASRDASPGTLGVRLRSREGGVAVTTVLPNSPAADAGLRVGDVILRVDNTPAANVDELIRLVQANPAGSVVELEIDRQGLRGPLEITLASENEVYRRAALGVTFSKASYRGARVLKVLPDSPAAAAGLRMGDRIIAINGRKVSDYREAIDRIGRLPPRTPLELEVDRYGLRGSLVATLGTQGEVFAPRPRPVPPRPVEVSPPTPGEIVEALTPGMINDQRTYGD